MMKHRLIRLTIIFIAAIFFAAQAVQAGELHDAAKAGDLQKVKLLLSQGANVNARNKDQKTPLHSAVFWGKTEVAELLISKGADVNARDDTQETPLHGLAWSDKIEMAELLIRKGADINARDKYGVSLLIIVATQGRTELVELLIRKGADVNLKNARMLTPLHWAAFMGHAEVAGLLLDAGADANAKNNVGETAADMAGGNNKPELAALIRNFSGGSARSDLKSLMHKVEKQGFINSHVVTLAAGLARSISPPPAIPQEAQDEMSKGMAAFKLAHQSKDFDIAAVHFKKAVLLAPWWPAPYYNWAVAMEKMRAFSLAKEQYGNYLRASPDAADAQAVKEKIAEMDLRMARVKQIDEHIKKANEYLANKNRVGAIEEIRETVRLEPDDGKLHFTLGHVLAYGGKHHAKEAITELEYAEHLGIKRYDLYWDLGNAYENLDEYDAAIDSYTKALALTIFDKEKKAKLHNNIGLAYEKKRNSKKALEHFKLAQKLGHPRKDYIRKQIRKHKRLLGR